MNFHFRGMEMVAMRPVEFESKEKQKFNGFYNKPDDELEDEVVTEESTRCPKRRKVVANLKLQTTFSFKYLVSSENPNLEGKLEDLFNNKQCPTNIEFPKPEIWFSPKSIGELDVAAIKVQKVYKSYRTRRNLADCAVVCEELWWKALDFATLNRCSISHFDSDKSETAISKWARARTMAAKVGKGLSKDDKAQKLALRHWLEAIDPRHRYGHNLHFYYNVWFHSQSSQPFFYWLDVGDGKEVNLEKCPRSELHKQCIKYLGPKEREAYEVSVKCGRLVYRQSQELVHTREGSKWIFVLSTSRTLYIGEKKKGQFQHSSFLAGGATIASGRLVAVNGVLDAIWPYSGHYRPTERNFKEFVGFLEEHKVDLTNVKRYAVDDDVPSGGKSMNEEEEKKSESREGKVGPNLEAAISINGVKVKESEKVVMVGQCEKKVETSSEEEEENKESKKSKSLSSKWTTGVGPRIGCVREYPTRLQLQALEQLNLSPRLTPPNKFSINKSSSPIPSPRPTSKIHLSPRLVRMGVHTTSPTSPTSF